MKKRIVFVALLATVSCQRAPVATQPERRVDVPLDIVLNSDYGPALALSPDGSMLALAGPQLYVRGTNEQKSKPLPGTEGARSPFFSPDGHWLAFFTDKQLKKVPVAGGDVVTLCDEGTSRGGVWSADGTIVFATIHGGLWRVPEAGGKPVTLTTLDLDERETTQRWPQSLANGKIVLFTAHSATEGFEDAHAVLQDLSSGWRRVVHRGGYHYRYLPDGRLVFISYGVLQAVPVDLKRFETTGTAAPIIDSVLAFSHNGAAQIATSSNGTLAYVPSGILGKLAINWLGKSKPLRPVQDYYYGLALSPDGRHAAFGLNDGRRFSVSVYDWQTDETKHLADTTGASTPIWSPDGKRVAYATANTVLWQRADGTGVAQLLGPSDVVRVPESWHPSGEYLAYRQYSSRYANDIFILEMKGEQPGKSTRLVGGPNDELNAAFSPDGKWFAYVSNDTSGVYSVYVRPFPKEVIPFLISPKGGTLPTWSKDGKTILFRGLDGRIMEVSYETAGNVITYSLPHPLSERISVDLARVRSYDQAPDGRVALLENVPQENPSKAVLVYNLNSSPGR